ncbi:MAG: hypothetical protein AB7G75_35200 [Candidatus Binatia bacterium]
MRPILTRQQRPAVAIVRWARTSTVLIALMFTVLTPPVQAQNPPYITASPNPALVPAGQPSGTTTLEWDGGDDHPYAEVWQQVDNADETFVVESGKGMRQMTVEAGKTYIFRLSDAGEILASVTVTAKNEPASVLRPLGGETSAEGDEAPLARTFPNAPGWITVIWEHSGKGVYGFVVERQGPPYTEEAILAVATLNDPTREFTDMNLQASTTYNHRVCAVYDYHRTCSQWARASTLAPPPSSSKAGGGKPPPPSAPPLSTPVLKATPNSGKVIYLEWDYSYADRLTSMALYRDGQFIFDGAIPGNFTRSHGDVVLRFNTEYTYKLCFSNPDEKDKCSEPVTAMGAPVPPTAPADVRVATAKRSGSVALGGAVRLRPKSVIDVTWRNTDVPGQFLTVEGLDTHIPGDIVAGGVLRTAPQQRWIEARRVSAQDDPTSLSMDLPRSLISSDTGLTTYRVCAVVPTLGDGGKVCSSPVSLP